jgi:hypothetical protein
LHNQKIMLIFVSYKQTLEIMSAKRLAVLEKSCQREFDANETMQWVNHNMLWRMTWGARNFTAFDKKALFFNVSGNNHKGIVLITLGWDDTYTITLLSTQWNVKQVIENVYCDDLAETIDIKVERIAEYNK